MTRTDRLLREAARLIDEACLERTSDLALHAIHLLHRLPAELTAPGTEGWTLLEEAIMLRDSRPVVS